MKTAGILECNEQKTTEFGFEFFIDVSLDSDKGVFRRYHTGNNPVNLVDPFGLYDAPPENPGYLVPGYYYDPLEKYRKNYKLDSKCLAK